VLWLEAARPLEPVLGALGARRPIVRNSLLDQFGEVWANVNRLPRMGLDVDPFTGIPLMEAVPVSVEPAREAEAADDGRSYIFCHGATAWMMMARSARNAAAASSTPAGESLWFRRARDVCWSPHHHS
jgi:hypothetical protein